jgi:hypothetical protein
MTTVPAQLTRMLDRLGLICAAGELAERAGIVPWPPGESRRALTQITLEWLDDRGSIEAGEQLSVLDHLRRVLFAQRDRFIRIVKSIDTKTCVTTLALESTRMVRDRLGYIIDSDYYIPPQIFDKECVPIGMNSRTARKQLAAAGVLFVDNSGEEHRSPVRQQVPDDEGELHRMRLIRILGAALHAEHGEDYDPNTVGVDPNHVSLDFTTE